MDTGEFVSSLMDAIVNNSNLEAEGDDTVLFDKVKSVSMDGDNGLSVSFTDGRTLVVSVSVRK